jgi:eukaryotic-like serine/threonine-protein kinase
MALAPGVRLGAYEVLGLLGSGGMGEVYKARDTRLDRTVAIKVLSEDFQADRNRRERFDREARAVAALNHSHICALHDVGESLNPEAAVAGSEPVRFLVMEYLEGQTLAERLIRGPMAASEVLRYAVEIADALDHAHRRGLVHRDLKPSNVMLTAGGAKLLDFGLSKQIQPDLVTLSTIAEGAPLTSEGALLGTYSYMAPEQLAGRESDTRSDIFAFGALVFEMATGRRAFEGMTAATVTAAILHTDPPAVSSLHPPATTALDRIVTRCLSKDADDRWQTARDLMLELKWVIERGTDHEADRPGRESPARLGLIATGVLAIGAVVAAAFTVVYARRTPDENTMVRLSFSPPDGVRLADVGIGGLATISPDGHHLAFIATGPDGKQLLWLRRLDSLDARALPGTEGAEDPFWSPDSEFIGFFSQRKLRKIHVLGGAVQPICDAIQSRGGTWSADNVIVFSANDGTQLYRVAARGGPAVTIPADGKNAKRYRPLFLSDGRHFIYRGRPQRGGIYVATLDSSETKLLLEGYVAAAYSPLGYLIGLLAPSRSAAFGTLFAHRFDLTRLEVTGDPTPLAERVQYRSGMGRGAFSISGNGLLVYGSVEHLATQLMWFDRSGRLIRSVGQSVSYNSPALSPDEQTIAVERFDPDGHSEGLWLIDTARDVSTRFTSSPTLDVGPVWSADGARIVFRSPRDTAPFLYQKTVSGKGGEELLLKSSAAYASDWSRDGRFLVYSDHDPNTQQDLWYLPISGARANEPRPFLKTPDNELSGQFSPDGRWLAYESDESGTSEVYIRSFPEADAKQRISVNGGRGPRWRADGSELFYLALDGMLMAASMKSATTLETGPPVALFKTRTPSVSAVDVRGANPNYIVTRAGQRFLINTVTEEHSVPTTIVLNWPAVLRQ